MADGGGKNHGQLRIILVGYWIKYTSSVLYFLLLCGKIEFGSKYQMIVIIVYYSYTVLCNISNKLTIWLCFHDFLKIKSNI